jgi:hypothetical protein
VSRRSKHPLLTGHTSKPEWKWQSNKHYQTNHSAYGPVIICNKNERSPHLQAHGGSVLFSKYFCLPWPRVCILFKQLTTFNTIFYSSPWSFCNVDITISLKDVNMAGWNTTVIVTSMTKQSLHGHKQGYSINLVITNQRCLTCHYFCIIFFHYNLL